jgi:RNA polymerase sigma factor (sigma-70 family)
MVIRQSESLLDPPTASWEAGTAAVASDDQLLAQFIADRDELAEVAFAALVRRHGPMVLHVCRQVLGDRHTAEDAFQATFLILVRRAGSIQKPELLGNWLHGVALRTAREASMRDHRRRRRESSGAELIAAQPCGEAGEPGVALVRREEFEALHDEVSRLPERYRVPVVLCDLEGLTYEQAADRLRCPVGTIGVRLRRARERLRVRLTRRGLAPTAGLVGALLGAEVARAQVPAPLVDSTVQAAMGFAAGEAATTGLLSGSVVTLTEAMLKLMVLARLKVAMSIALAIGMAATVIWVGVRRQPIARAAHAQGIAGPRDAARPSRNAVAPSGANALQRDEAPPAVKPVAPEHGQPKPRDESPLLRSAPDSILAGAAIRDERVGATPRRKEEIVRDSHHKGPERTTIVAAEPNRMREDEPARGAVLFAKEWMPNEHSIYGGDGLGPVYNDSSCVACHGMGGPGGAGPESKNVILMVPSSSGCGPTKPLDQIHPGFRGSRSAVLHRYGTDPEYERWRSRFLSSRSINGSSSGAEPIQARIQALKLQAARERRLGTGAPELGTMDGVTFKLEERNTPPLFGLGRIDEIPSEALVAAAAAQPSAVRGRVNRTREGRIGRFGWKAQVPSLHEFVRGACANELGLEVPGKSQAISPLAPTEKAKALDLSEPDCDALVAYVRALPAPVVIDPSEPNGTRELREGRRLFADVGCASCHSPTLGDVRGIYSDLLLHDMGASLSDSAGTYGSPGPDSPDGRLAREWRTPPLWGFRDSGPYLHDGRAQNLEEAVAFHEGQGAASARRFFARSALERARIEAFLKSLVAPPATFAPGVRLAAEIESEFGAESRDMPEAFVRREREESAARDEQKWREAQRRRRALDAAKRARVQIPIAQSLEKMGKITGALAFYRDIARLADGTDEGRLAATRIAELSSRVGLESNLVPLVDDGRSIPRAQPTIAQPLDRTTSRARNRRPH